METSKEKKPGSWISDQPDASGESMKDSMTETPKGNDNSKMPSAEDLTNENGELDAEAFKKSYEQPAQSDKNHKGTDN